MRRFIVAMLAIAFSAVPVVATAATKRHVHFTSRIVGADIGNNQIAFTVHDSVFGSGAGVQTIKITKPGAGSDTDVIYYGNGTARSKGTFTIGAADANGVAKITGSGRDVGGTGRARGLRSTYTYTGTINLKSTVYRITLKGVYTY